MRSIRQILTAALAAPLAALAADRKDTVGGQALVEGVMMRSKEKVAWAVRRPDGETVVESFPFISVTKRIAVCKTPVVRGVINLFESLSWGYKALSRSVDISAAEVDASDKPSDSPAGAPKPSFADRVLMTLSTLVAFAISIGLFMYAPMWTASRVHFINEPTALFNLLGGKISINVLQSLLFNLFAGTIRIALFLMYMSLISLWSEMRRVFEYHGAEHKTIFAYEDGKELTIENVEPYTTLHPRCGTSFLILVAICSILLFSVIDTLYIHYIYDFRNNLPYRFAVHLALIPLVAGVSYEFLKLSARFQHWPVVGLLVKPGLWLQRITTRKPDGSQIEVAVKALEAAL
ncbi:MAG: DUF1385 domain-containing protein [Chitinispirillales bacterium]|jgi:uncharacterized protein YqhQ|nr:DUF1385 domain-containing protein [Chitinispirillales bacterium]